MFLRCGSNLLLERQNGSKRRENETFRAFSTKHFFSRYPQASKLRKLLFLGETNKRGRDQNPFFRSNDGILKYRRSTGIIRRKFQHLFSLPGRALLVVRGANQSSPPPSSLFARNKRNPTWGRDEDRLPQRYDGDIGRGERDTQEGKRSSVGNQSWLDESACSPIYFFAFGEEEEKDEQGWLGG